MEEPSRPSQRRFAVWTAAVALFAVVFVIRQLNGTALDGVNFLYLLPICLVAIELGVRPGLAAAAIGIGLVGAWDQLNAEGLTLTAYAVRITVFGGVGLLCAVMAERVRKAGEESDRYFEMSSQMLGIFTFDGTPVRLNRGWTDFLGRSQQQLMAADMTQSVHPDDVDLVRTKVAESVGAGRDGQVSFTIRLLTADGALRHVSVSNTVDVRRRLVYVAATDVTERLQLENARRSAEERFRVAFEDSATGMAVVALTARPEGEIVEANQELSRVLGVPRERLLGMSGLGDFTHPDDTARLRAEMAGLASGVHAVVRSEIRIVRPNDHSVRWVHLTSSLLHDDDGRPLFRLSQILDIDARKRSDEQLRYVADHDAMSGLLNRRRFMSDLESELDRARAHGSRGAVLVIDLDHFKQVNDSAGHAVGDEVIATVGRALTARLRSGDLAGRMGGDEFAVLLRRVQMEEALLVAHQLLEAVQAELSELDHPAARAVTLSIGIACLDGSLAPLADNLLAQADAAMYAAKDGGGSRVGLAAESLGFSAG